MKILLIFLLPLLFEAKENCTIYIDPNQTTGLPDQVPAKRNETYTVIETNPNTTGAMCLDGSTYKFLYHPGSGANQKKFHFYFQGAAYCGADGYETLESCYQRSLTNLGSNSDFGANGSTFEKNISVGYASSDAETNPTFYNWNILFVTYCDGTNGQGYLEEPLMYNGTIPIWIRGFNNTLSVFEYAREHLNLFEAEEVMISGGSSGGTSALVWAAYLQDYFPKTVKFFGLSDGGIFLDLFDGAADCHLFRFFMQNLAYLTNANATELYRKCPYRDSLDEVWKCMIPQYMYQTVDIPFFIANSQIDTVQLGTLFGVYCLDDGGPIFCTDVEKEKIVAFREEMLNVTLEMKKNKKNWGFWLRSCFEHCYQFTWAWYGGGMEVFNAEIGSSLGLRRALDYWYYRTNDTETRSTTSFIDLLDWNHNPMCIYDETYLPTSWEK